MIGFTGPPITSLGELMREDDAPSHDAKDVRIAELERERDTALARAEKVEAELANLRWDNEMMRCPRCNNPTDGPPCEVCKARTELAERKQYDDDVRFVCSAAREVARDQARNILAATTLKKEGK